MRFAIFLAILAAAFAAVVACGSGNLVTVDPEFQIDASNTAVITPIDAAAAPQGAAGTGLLTGLPCDVQALLENRCIGCHDGSRAGVPRLLDYADLVAASQSDPAKTMAQVALERMQNTANPMPPAPAVPADADEIGTMQDWLNAGLPQGGVCTQPVDASASDTGALDAGADADGGPACASGVLWTNGDTGSALMHPGVACLACHQQNRGPDYSFAGTVYLGPHDVDDCNGKGPPPTLTVQVTDSKAQVVTGTVNAAGNFMIDSPSRDPRGRGIHLSAPFRATVSDGTNTRSMMGEVTSGDCNSCHTVDGKNGAPGRIVAP